MPIWTEDESIFRRFAFFSVDILFTVHLTISFDDDNGRKQRG